jgi:hypothetical protein
MAMAVARLGIDEWVATDGQGDLPAMLQRHLDALEISATAP